MSKKLPLDQSDREQILKMILHAYATHPEKLEATVPEIAQRLALLSRREARATRSFGLTERENAQYINTLRVLLTEVSKRSLSADQAVQALEKCAALVEGNSLPADITRDVLMKLVKQVTGSTPSVVKKTMRVQINDFGDSEASKQISLLRGVLLNLTWDNRLLSVDIVPSKIKEFRRAMKFVGAIEGPEPDIAEKHNIYLGGTKNSG